MERLSIILSALLVTWLILFDQQIVIKTAGFYVDEYEAEETVVTTEATSTNDNNRNTLVTTETTSINDNDRNILVDDNKTPVHTDDKKEIDKPESSSDDIIDLNVGGQRFKTYRSTLTAVPNSKLALMFTKDNNKKIATKIKQDQAYFLDYNPVQFEYLLDQLRAIKRTPQTPAHELNFKTPAADVPFNFSNILFDLGLNAAQFLLPLVGTHLDLNVSSLIGWKECYRGKYDKPFDATVLTNTCKGKRLLVACRPAANQAILTVAGIGKREDLFQTCSSNSYCSTTMQNDTGFYYVKNQAWGFRGQPKDLVTTYNPYGGFYHHGGQGSFLLNPCDSSDEYPQYRLCWSLRSNVGRGGGDRCGSSKNLHNTKGWERLIYQTV